MQTHCRAEQSSHLQRNSMLILFRGLERRLKKSWDVKSKYFSDTLICSMDKSTNHSNPKAPCLNGFQWKVLKLVCFTRMHGAGWFWRSGCLTDALSRLSLWDHAFSNEVLSQILDRKFSLGLGVLQNLCHLGFHLISSEAIKSTRALHVNNLQIST